MADVNGDGNMDIVVPNGTSQSVSVLFGRADGTFQTAVQYSVGKDAYFVAVGDFNGDGRADLAIANTIPDGIDLNPDNEVTILLGTPHGTFTPGGSYTLANLPFVITVADLNRDGRSDLAVADAQGGF